MIAGFEQPTAGTIRVDGKDITARPAEPAQRRDGLPVVRPLPEHDRRRQRRVRPAGPQAAEATRSASGWPSCSSSSTCPTRPTAIPWQLSGGQQQRVALARALAIEPQVLLLDEPLSALDAKIRIILRNEIRAIQRELGITTVYVTHDQEEALSLSDRIVVMSEGRIEQIGTPFEIYNFPATSFVASFVGHPQRPRDDGRRRERRAGWRSTARRSGRPSPITGPRDGAKQPIAIRPEMLSMGEGGGANVMRGTVEDVTFLGSVVRIRVRTAADGHDPLDRHVQRPEPRGPRTWRRRDRELPARGGPRPRRPARRDRRGPDRRVVTRRGRGGPRGPRRPTPASAAIRRASSASTSSSSTRTARSSSSTRCGAAGRPSSRTDLEAATDRLAPRAALRRLRRRPADRPGSVPTAALAATPMSILRAARRSTSSPGPADRTRRPRRPSSAAWHPPDPVALARPAHRPRRACSRRSGRPAPVSPSRRPTIASPTERTLAALGLADLVDATVCADDGLAGQAGAGR